MQFLGHDGATDNRSMSLGNYQRERRHRLWALKNARKNGWWLLVDEDRAKLAWLRYRRYGSTKCAELAIKYGG